MRPEALLPTRVGRFYRGGALLGRLRGEPEEDGYLPEDWLGSTTLARNAVSAPAPAEPAPPLSAGSVEPTPVSAPAPAKPAPPLSAGSVEPTPVSAPAPAKPAPPLSAGSVEPTPESEGSEEGLSRLADGRLLRDAIEADPVGWLGAEHVERFGTSTGLLVKLLDSAERLPVHAHPDRAFAKRELGSPFGKTEAWIVLDTRGAEGRVWVGLREPVEPERYLDWIERQDVESLLGSLNELAVRRGDVVYVPGGVPHAIGAGVLIAELQEPTDFSLLCEWHGFPVRVEESHLGLGWERALRALDLRAHEPVRALPPEAREFFWADREPQATARFTILLVLAGAGSIAGADAGPGDAFAVPAAAADLELEGELEVLRCLAPDPGS